MENPGAVNRELTRVLMAAGSHAAPCPIDAAELRRLVVEYLTDYDAELARFPELASVPRWNLWQWDWPGEFDRDSYFVALVVRPGGLEFAPGHGRQQCVREFADSDFPDEVERVVPELARHFALPCGSIRVGRLVAEAWAGRGLGVSLDLESGDSDRPPPR